MKLVNRIREIFKTEINYTYLDYLKRKYSKYKHICIFGAGNIGFGTADAFIKEGISIDFFCDNDKKKVGKLYNNIKCISFNELTKIKQETIVIIATRYYKDIYNQLIEYNFLNIDRVFTNKFNIDNYLVNNNRENIILRLEELMDILEDKESKRILVRIIEEWFNHEYNYGQLDDICSDDQYFCEDIIKLSQHEVFLDGGAYIGDTLDDFLEKCDYKFDKAILFELNERIYGSLKHNIEYKHHNVIDKIFSYNMGLSNSENEIFYDDFDEGSIINDSGNNKGKIVSIDNILNERVTFIKMDIEGEEVLALEGARDTIKKYKPKLAICLYHNPDHLWEIPLYIKKIVPEYKIYIRHHTDLLNETVCYAIIK